MSNAASIRAHGLCLMKQGQLMIEAANAADAGDYSTYKEKVAQATAVGVASIRAFAKDTPSETIKQLIDAVKGT